MSDKINYRTPVPCFGYHNPKSSIELLKRLNTKTSIIQKIINKLLP